MKWVYICSPLRGDYEANTAAAIRHCREVAQQGDFPIAPHIYCPRFLDDTKPEERKWGMEIGAELLAMCSELRVYGDYISEGMRAEIQYAQSRGIPILYIRGKQA